MPTTTEQLLRNEVSKVDAIVIKAACLMSPPHPFVTVPTRSMFSVHMFRTSGFTLVSVSVCYQLKQNKIYQR